MRIFPVVIAEASYFDLYSLFEKSIRKIDYPFEPTRLYLKKNDVLPWDHSLFMIQHKVIRRVRPDGYGMWGDWACCEAYFEVLKDLARDPMIGDDDYVMDADSDVVVRNTAFLEKANGAEMVALPLVENIWTTDGVKWHHHSGCFMMFKGSCLRKMAGANIAAVKKIMADSKIPFIDDTFVCTLARTLGIKIEPLDWVKTVVQNEEDVILGKTQSDASIFHFVGDAGRWKTFLGVPVTGKKDLPRAVRVSGVDFP